jgi:hypothetical protein
VAVSFGYLADHRNATEPNDLTLDDVVVKQGRGQA